MISREGVHEQQYPVSDYEINNLIYMWQGEAIFWARFVEVIVIYTNSPLATFCGTTTTLASHSGYFTSLIKPALSKFSTSV